MANHRDFLIAASRGVLSGMASALITQMGITDNVSQPVVFLDNACGSGVLTQEIQKRIPRVLLERSNFLCSDQEASMVDLVKSRVLDEGWVNTDVGILDAMGTGLPTHSFTHIGLGMALHMIPNLDAVLADCKRILKPGGILGATVPHADGIFWVADMRSAFNSFPFPAPFPDQVPTQLHDQGNWSDSEWIARHLEDNGFRNITVKTVAGTYYVKSAQDFVDTFGMMLERFLAMWWPEKTRQEHPIEQVLMLIKDHLVTKYEGQGWDIEWMLICFTAFNEV